MQMQYFEIGFDSAHAVFERGIAAARAGLLGSEAEVRDWNDVKQEEAEKMRDAMASELYSAYDRTLAKKLLHGFICGADCFWGVFKRWQLDHAGDTDWEMEQASEELRHTLRASGNGSSEAAAEAYVKSNREFRADYEAQLRQLEQLYAHLVR
jgi:hypothetical protein